MTASSARVFRSIERKRGNDVLVLSRKTNESIMIGGNVEIVVLGIDGDNVKIGINAPKEVGIFRKEVYMTIQAANRDAAHSRASLSQAAELLNRKQNDLK